MLRLDSIAVAAKEVLSFGGTGISNENKEVCGMTGLAICKDSVVEWDLGQNLVVLYSKTSKCGRVFYIRGAEHRVANGKYGELGWQPLQICVNLVKVVRFSDVRQGAGDGLLGTRVGVYRFLVRAHQDRINVRQFAEGFEKRRKL